jgi:uncharacterized protein (TIGR02145 family)
MNKIFKSYLLSIILFGLMILVSCDKDKPQSDLPVDGDGNEYDTIVIGTQTWLMENLKTTKYINGIPIYLVTDNSKWITWPVGAYCWYENNLDYKDTYGALYNWNAVSLDLLCPAGYHVPTDKEWGTLIYYLGGEEIAGGKLKATGTEFWAVPNQFATNESGFSALPGGYREHNGGSFNQIRYTGTWWTSSPGLNEDNGRRVDIYHYYSAAYLMGISKKAGVSVRCIKDN